MNYYTKQIQKIIAKTSNKKGRYAQAKSFEDGCNLFVAFVISQLQELSNFSFKSSVASSILDATPKLQDELHWETARYIVKVHNVMSNIIQEYALLQEAYQITIPINFESVEILKDTFSKWEKKISSAINDIHDIVMKLQHRASHTGLNKDKNYNKEKKILSLLLKFELNTLVSMFTTGKLPKIITLLGEYHI